MTVQPNSNTARKRPTGDNGNKNVIIISIISILLAVSVINFFLDLQKKGELEAEIEKGKVELQETKTKLDEISTELDEKIAKIEELGGNIDELLAIKAELEEEKASLKKSTRERVNRMQRKIKGYERLLKEKDQEIENLKLFNQELLTENVGLKDDKNALNDSIMALSAEKGSLEDKVAIASKLEAEDISIYAINDKGKAREASFKAKQIDVLSIEFSLSENEVASIENIDVYINIIDPDQSTIFDVATGSGTFIFKGREQFYTATKDVLYDKKKQQLTFIYDKGSEYLPGEYYVEIYAKDFIIGGQSFIVK